MLHWFFRLFNRRQHFEPPAVIIYSFNNGREYIRGDPMRIAGRLITDEEIDLDQECQASAFDGAQGIKAQMRLADLVRKAFDLPAVRDGGLTDSQCVALLADFTRWEEQQKRFFSPSPISAPTIPATLVGDSPPESPTSSTSAGTELPLDEASPSSSGSAPPSEAVPTGSGTP